MTGTWRYSPLLLLLPHANTPLFLLLCFVADEIKDDFDSLGPDATLPAVGNGTGMFIFPFLPPWTLKVSNLSSPLVPLSTRTYGGCLCFDMHYSVQHQCKYV